MFGVGCLIDGICCGGDDDCLEVRVDRLVCECDFSEATWEVTEADRKSLPLALDLERGNTKGLEVGEGDPEPIMSSSSRSSSSLT